MTSDSSGFKLEEVINVDAKGQIFLQKNVREKASFVPNRKIALLTIEKNGAFCCLLLIKAEKLGDALSQLLGGKEKTSAKSKKE